MSTFAINNIPIMNPTKFKIERYNITTMNRLANGTMVGDLVAKKRKFYFTYDAISGDELDNILEAIWETNEIFYKLDYLENGVAKSAEVYVGSIPTDLHRAGQTTNWVWKNVTFNLIER